MIPIVSASVRLARIAGGTGVQLHVEDNASGETIFSAIFNAEDFAALKRGTTVTVPGSLTAHHERLGHEMTVSFLEVPPGVLKSHRDVTIAVIEWFQTQPAYVTAHEFAIEENDGVWRVAAREWDGLELVGDDEEDVEEGVDTAQPAD